MSATKVRTLDGKVSRVGLVDLILFDCQENLLVPEVSFPLTHIPAWNFDLEYEAIQMAFLFADMHLQDHGCMIVFHSYCAASKGVIQGLCETYPSFVKKFEWLGVNRMYLTSAMDNAATVRI